MVYVNSKKKKKLMKKRQKEEQFIRNNPDLYMAYRNRGFGHEKAVYYMKKELSQKKVKKGTKTLEKLKGRYQMNVERPGIQAISLEDIERTKAVDDWINNMTQKGAIVDMGYQLKFPKNEKLGRY